MARLTVKLVLDDVVQHLKKVEDEVVIGRLGKQVPSGGEGLWVEKTTKDMYVQLPVQMCQAIFTLIFLIQHAHVCSMHVANVHSLYKKG